MVTAFTQGKASAAKERNGGFVFMVLGEVIECGGSKVVCPDAVGRESDRAG
jgi:hypothetical protein